MEFFQIFPFHSILAMDNRTHNFLNRIDGKIPGHLFIKFLKVPSPQKYALMYVASFIFLCVGQYTLLRPS